MKEKQTKIQIKGPRISYSNTISPELAGVLISACEKDKGNNVITPTNSPIIQKESVAEYVHSKGPKRNPDKMLAIAGYLVKDGRETFSPEDIRQSFPKIGEPLPSNFGRDFRWVAANGWFAEHVNEPNQFYVTNTGNRVLDSNFSKEVIENTKQKTRLKSSRKKKKIEN